MELEINQYLELKVKDGIYRGEYLVRVLGMNESVLAISMPNKRGRIIPLNVGLLLTVSTLDIENKFSFETEIIDRRMKPLPALIVTRPHRISRAQRQPLLGMSRVITVTSGKGGVGKTNFAVNLAIALRQLNKKVLVLDADLGLANVDVVVGCFPDYNLGHVISGEKRITEIITEGPGGIELIAGGSGLQELSDLSDVQLSRFINSLNELEGRADIILIDTGAGLSKRVLNFILAADEIIVVTTPEPTSVTDAYAIIKVIARENEARNRVVKLVVNKADNAYEAKRTADKLIGVSKQFLDINLEDLGYIFNDASMIKAVREQQPLLISYPKSKAAECIHRVAANLCQQPYIVTENTGVRSFFSKMIKLFREIGGRSDEAKG